MCGNFFMYILKIYMYIQRAKDKYMYAYSIPKPLFPPLVYPPPHLQLPVTGEIPTSHVRYLHSPN